MGQGSMGGGEKITEPVVEVGEALFLLFFVYPDVDVGDQGLDGVFWQVALGLFEEGAEVRVLLDQGGDFALYGDGLVGWRLFRHGGPGRGMGEAGFEATQHPHGGLAGGGG